MRMKDNRKNRRYLQRQSRIQTDYSVKTWSHEFCSQINLFQSPVVFNFGEPEKIASVDQ